MAASGRGSGMRVTEPLLPETFQTQRVIYIRGFARNREKGAKLIEKIREFYDRLCPHPDDPDNRENLVKDIRPIWFSTEDIFIEEPDENTPQTKDAAAKKEEPKKDAAPKKGYWLQEFVLEAYTEGTREKDTKKKEGAAAKAIPVAGATQGTQPAPTVAAPAPAAAPGVPVAPAVERTVPAKVHPDAPRAIQPVVPAPAQPQDQQTPRRRFITPDKAPPVPANPAPAPVPVPVPEKKG